MTQLATTEAITAGEAKPTICAKCASLYVPYKSAPPGRWLCKAHPMPQALSFLTGDTVADPPYGYCQRINKGNCPDFAEGVNSLSPDKLNREGDEHV